MFAIQKQGYVSSAGGNSHLHLFQSFSSNVPGLSR